MATPASNGTRNGGESKQQQQQQLEVRFPVHSTWKLTLQSNETVQGLVYCTDEASQVVVLQTALTHTTLAAEVRIIHSSSIVKAVEIKKAANDGEEENPLSAPLPKIQKKVLEERERRAIRMAEESLRHINQKASPQGQLVFDKLLKACSEAVWKGESILVLKQVQVDPPYGPEHCKIVQRNAGKKALDDGSLERIKKIVAAAAISSSS